MLYVQFNLNISKVQKGSFGKGAMMQNLGCLEGQSEKHFHYQKLINYFIK